MITTYSNHLNKEDEEIDRQIRDTLVEIITMKIINKRIQNQIYVKYVAEITIQHFLVYTSGTNLIRQNKKY